MEFMTSAILSGFLYDMLKHGVSITADSVKEKLKDWILDDSIAPTFSKELADLNLNDELSETTITQNHSGTGDNIGRDKNIK